MAALCRIRTAAPSDGGALALLEKRCFSDPWSAAGLRDLVTSTQTITLVAELRGEIVGYAIARWAAETGEILNLAVAPEHRRAGIAGQMLEEILDGLRQRGVREVYLEVRESNEAARGLYGRRGFWVAGMRRAYYRTPTEDALVLRLPLGEPA